MIDIIGVAAPNTISPVAEAEDQRWREWKQKGRADEARFQRKLRNVVVDVAGAVAIGGAAWYAWVTWL